jgi:transmembrane sensor
MDVRRDIPATPPGADLEAEARAWIVRLKSGTATEADLSRLAAWRQASPAAEAAFGRARAVWAALGPALDADASARVVPLHRPGMSRRAIFGAGAGAIAAGLAGVAWFGATREPAASAGVIVATAKGERRRLAIGQTAVADLNTASRVRVWTEAGVQGLELLKGEAIMTVAPSPLRIVALVGRALVSSRGGQFLMRIEGEAASILCLKGQVRVSAGAERLTLDPDQLVTIAAEAVRLSRTADVESATSWRSGQLVYENRPLADVVEELNRYRPGRIVVRGEGLAERRVSGVVQLDRIDGALTNFARSLGVGVTRLPGGVVILG